MSFGRPPTFSDFKVSPPERGSFPLDHEGECKSVMQEYMNCIKYNKNDNGKCRHLSKAYLQCRMDKGLMEHDEMDNLGFKDVIPPSSGTTNAAADRIASQNRTAHTGSTPSYAGDTHGAEGNIASAKAGSGSPADEHNRGPGAGVGNAKGHASRQAGSYAGDSHGRSGAGRLV
ncbi:related to COX19 - Cytochrome c oxidase assembly protein [Ustilago trichophora]|uniref:Related to COX19 - Cytochrome c oxidase assembly protein n=1 Tax=Ustilago trichophora TaxID=86804 RepID=A0A5C3EF58_9BASI|nr:related to COX19 - Cytochrome c oxidase assembly protein [Ustilago trichophora]